MSFIDDFKRRVKENTTKRWIRFGIVSLLFFLWVAWLGNWWVALWWFLLFDIYITGFIPFTWWKKSKSAATRTVMGWVDAIVYALVLVYFVFAFIGQNYQIPSSSLEKSLLTGDYLWVNKTAYGPRVPMTPVHFPLVQNTLFGAKSYLERPQWPYHRLKGTGSIRLGDIVVFNFPGGDSIALLRQNPDIYMMSRELGEQMVFYGAIAEPQGDVNERDAALRAAGMAYIRNNPAQFGEVMWRPVDRRENYVKRAVGLPGRTFQIKGGEIYNDGVRMPMPDDAQFKYAIRHKRYSSMRQAPDEFWDNLGVSRADRVADGDETDVQPPLTAAMVAKLKADPEVISVGKVVYEPYRMLLFPLATAAANGWTLDDYGPVTIPARGMTVKLDEEGWATYGHAITHYEGVNADWHDGRAYIDGKPADSYTFKMDYYFMMGDNRHKSLDSRFWGFVPEDHIVGRPERVLISFDPDKSFPFNIRWNRILKKASN